MERHGEAWRGLFEVSYWTSARLKTTRPEVRDSEWLATQHNRIAASQVERLIDRLISFELFLTSPLGGGGDFALGTAAQASPVQ